MAEQPHADRVLAMTAAIKKAATHEQLLSVVVAVYDRGERNLVSPWEIQGLEAKARDRAVQIFHDAMHAQRKTFERIEGILSTEKYANG